ncbi:hypothetical protein BGX26_001818 [Mortierella sp. AD094]|nr:hypothetical protein BGX26_001818 [Mortierella sp. AD094]
MAHSVKQQTKKIVDTLHNWLFDNSAYTFSDEPQPTACTTAQVSASGSCGAQGSQDNGGLGSYANAVHNKFAAIASSASSAASNTATSLFDSDNSGDKGDKKSFLGESSYHRILEKLQSLASPSYWQQTDPSAAWNNYISNHASDSHPLQSRMNQLSKSLGVETRVLVVTLLLLFVLLLLIACATRHTSTESGKEEEEFHYGIGLGREPDLSNTEGNQVRGSHTTTATTTTKTTEKAPADSAANGAHEHDVCRSPTSEFPKRTRRPSIINGEGVMSTILEGASALRREEDEIEFDNYEDYEENVSENESVDPSSSTIQCRPSKSKSTHQQDQSKHHTTPVAVNRLSAKDKGRSKTAGNSKLLANGNQNQNISAPTMAANTCRPSQRSVGPTLLKSKTEKTEDATERKAGKDDINDMTKLVSSDLAWTENTIMSEPSTAAPTSSSKTGSNIEEAISTVLSTIQDSGRQVKSSVKESIVEAGDTVQTTAEEIKKAVEAALAFAEKTRFNTVESVKSLPSRGSSSSLASSVSFSSSTTLTTPSKTAAKNVKHEAVFTGKSDLIPYRRGSLDHDEYVFRNSNGDPVSADELSEDSSNSDDDYEDDDQENKGRGVFSIVPGILYTATAAACAMVARVTDVSYENIDIAKTYITGIVNNTVGTLTRRGRTKYENDSDEGQDDVMSSSTSTSGAEEVNLTPVSATLVSSKPDLTNISAFKPNCKSHHVDKDGFTVVEDPHLLQDRRTYTSITTTSQDPPPSETLHQTRNHDYQAHTTTSSPPNQITAKKDRSDTISHLVTSDLSYSRAIMMNLAESDHGVRVGMTESYENDSISSEDSSPDDQDPTPNNNVSVPSTISVDKEYHQQAVNYHNQLLHQVIHSHEGNTPPLSPSITNVSFEHGHGMLHGVSANHEGSSSFRDDIQNLKQNKVSTEEYSISENGEKVPVVDDRRDSGVHIAS